MTVVHLCAPNDTSGNPRRCYVAIDPELGMVGVQDEGYDGDRIAKQRFGAGVAFRSSIRVPPSEYRDFLRAEGSGAFSDAWRRYEAREKIAIMVMFPDGGGRQRVTWRKRCFALESVTGCGDVYRFSPATLARFLRREGGARERETLCKVVINTDDSRILHCYGEHGAHLADVAYDSGMRDGRRLAYATLTICG